MTIDDIQNLWELCEAKAASQPAEREFFDPSPDYRSLSSFFSDILRYYKIGPNPTKLCEMLEAFDASLPAEDAMKALNNPASTVRQLLILWSIGLS